MSNRYTLEYVLDTLKKEGLIVEEDADTAAAELHEANIEVSLVYENALNPSHC